MYQKNVIFAFITFAGIFFILQIPKPTLSRYRNIDVHQAVGREYVFYAKENVPKEKTGYYLIVLPQLSVEHKAPSTNLDVIDAYAMSRVNMIDFKRLYLHLN